MVKAQLQGVVREGSGSSAVEKWDRTKLSGSVLLSKGTEQHPSLGFRKERDVSHGHRKDGQHGCPIHWADPKFSLSPRDSL